jgi:PAS domain S-box-containing protein
MAFADHDTQIILQTALDAVIVTDSDSRVLVWNSAAETIFGYSSDEATGQALCNLIVPPDLCDRHEEAVRRYLETGHSTLLGRRIEIDAVRAGGQRFPVELAINQFREGEAVYFIARLRDISEQRRVIERQNTMMHELDHRVRNTLAIVQSIVSHTLRNAGVDRNVRSQVSERIVALGNAHSILSLQNWKAAEVAAVVQQSLSAHERIRADGPPLWLRPAEVIALSLVLHELATNAAKYGALSNSKGHVDLAWAFREGLVCLDWSERGGPAVRPPSRVGFGTEMMRRVGNAEDRASIELIFDPDGLRAEIRMAGSSSPL